MSLERRFHVIRDGNCAYYAYAVGLINILLSDDANVIRDGVIALIDFFHNVPNCSSARLSGYSDITVGLFFTSLCYAARRPSFEGLCSFVRDHSDSHDQLVGLYVSLASALRLLAALSSDNIEDSSLQQGTWGGLTEFLKLTEIFQVRFEIILIDSHAIPEETQRAVLQAVNNLPPSPVMRFGYVNDNHYDYISVPSDVVYRFSSPGNVVQQTVQRDDYDPPDDDCEFSLFDQQFGSSLSLESSGFVLQNSSNLYRYGHVRTLDITESFMCFHGSTRTKNVNNFVWDNIPMFSVVTGHVGSGKSSLLIALIRGIQRTNSIDVHLSSNSFNLEDVDVVYLEDWKVSSKSGVELPITIERRKEIDDRLKSFAKFLIEDSYHVNNNDRPLFSAVRNFLLKVEPSKTKLFTEHRNLIEEILMPLCDFEFSKHGNLKWVLNFCILQFVIKTEAIPSHLNGITDRFKHALRYAVNEVNGILKIGGFKFLIIFDDITHIGNSARFDIRNFKSISGNEKVFFGNMTPGEGVQMMVILWSVIERRANMRRLILLDEFDAHVHPELIKGLVVSLEKLVSTQNIQVVMVTHRPDTLSLLSIYAGSAHFYELVRAPGSSPSIVARDVKHHADLLTDGLVHVLPPFRHVFVEAEHDKEFHQLSLKALFSAGYISAVPVLFHVHGSRRGKKSTDADSSSSDQVRNIVNKLTGPGAVDAEISATLGAFVYGILDGDNRVVDTKGANDSRNLFYLRRYSLENYLFDPLLLFFYFCWSAQKGSNTAEAKLMREKYEKIVLDLSLEMPNTNPPSSVRELLSMAATRQQDVMQAIVNALGNRVASFLSAVISGTFHDVHNFENLLDSSYSKFCEGILGARADGDKRLCLLLNTQGLRGQAALNRTTFDVSLVGGVTLHYPHFLLYMRGHDLCSVIQYLFGKELVIHRKMLKFLMDLESESVLCPLLPMDLGNILKGIVGDVTRKPSVPEFDRRAEDEKDVIRTKEDEKENIGGSGLGTGEPRGESEPSALTFPTFTGPWRAFLVCAGILVSVGVIQFAFGRKRRMF